MTIKKGVGVILTYKKCTIAQKGTIRSNFNNSAMNEGKLFSSIKLKWNLLPSAWARLIKVDANKQSNADRGRLTCEGDSCSGRSWRRTCEENQPNLITSTVLPKLLTCFSLVWLVDDRQDFHLRRFEWLLVAGYHKVYRLLLKWPATDWQRPLTETKCCSDCSRISCRASFIRVFPTTGKTSSDFVSRLSVHVRSAYVILEWYTYSN